MNRLNNNNIRIATFAAWATAIVASASVAWSCSTKEDLDSRGVIRLGASASAPASRAAINNLTDLSQHGGDKVGIFGLETDHSTPVFGAWGGNLVMKNVRTTAVDADGALHWSGTYYYPLEDERYVEFFAYHPYAELAGEGSDYVSFSGTDTAPVLHFTLDGSQDVLYSAPVVGSISVSPGKLSFRHALTRLTFALNDPDGAYAGATLNGITFQQVRTQGSMNIENGALGEWSAPQDLRMAMPAGSVAIDAKDQMQTVDGEMMLEPGLESFFITVHTSYGDVPNVKITPKTNADGSKADKFAAEQSYRITLKFDTMKEIESSAKVEDWVFGGYGHGVVQ